MPPVTSRPDRFLYLLLAVVLVVLLYNLHLWAITGTETIIVDISRDMLARQNFMHPQPGVPAVSHLPLPLWFTSLGMTLWGINPFGARFFVQVGIVLQVVLVYRIALRLFGSHQVGLFAGLIYLSCPLVLACSRYLSAEIFLATFELSAIYCILLYHLDKRPIALYGLAGSLALGVLCRGLLCLVLPLSVGAYVLLFGPQNYYIHWRHSAAAATMGLGRGGLWFVHGSTHLPEFWSATRQLVWQETFFGPYPHWLPVVGLMVGCLPWWIVVALNLAGPLWQNPTIAQLAVCWLALPLGFYTLTGSVPWTGLLPTVAGVCILISYLIQLLTPGQVWQYSRWFAQIYSTLAILALVVPLGYQLLGQSISVTWPMAFTALVTLGVVGVLYRFIQTGIRFRLVAMALVPSLMLLLYGGYWIDANGAAVPGQ